MVQAFIGSNERVVKVVEVYEHRQIIWCVTEKMSIGLHQFISSNLEDYSEMCVKYILKCILEGLEVLH